MVQMNNVRKVYESSNTVALDGVRLTINDGEFVFLVCPSGSGKTTITKLITGEVRPTSGQIVTHEKELVNAFSKRVITIDGGNLISDGMDGYYSYEIE